MSQVNRTAAHDTDDLIRLSYFTDIAKAISSTRSLKETLDEVMRQIGKVFAPRNWSLLLKNPKTGELTFSVVIGSSDVTSTLKGVTVPPGRGIAGWIAENAEPLIIEDVHSDERFDPSIDEMLNFKTRSIIGVPLKSGDRVFGVIELINKMDGEAFTALDLKLLSTIAEFAGIAVEKSYYMKALRKIATIDHLTGVYNRRSCVRILEREISRCHRHGTTLATLMIDIDDFKEINDTYGHATGDQVLTGFAAIVSRCIRRVDYVCRYGGDEFIIILPDAEPNTARDVRDRIRDEVAKYDEEHPVRYTVSVGTFEGCPEGIADLFDSADQELYAEKEQRGGANGADKGSTATLTDRTERTIEEIPAHISDFFYEDAEESG